MASAFSHVVAAVAIGTFFRPAFVPRRWWLLGAVFSVIPDADLAMPFAYSHPLGHRGFTHSLLFAATLAWVGSLASSTESPASAHRLSFWLYLFLATASHGVLDATTNGGLGVGFFIPFNNDRYFFPFRPVTVSPIGFAQFFSPRGIGVLKSEVAWIWVPSAAASAIALLVHRYCHVRSAPAPRPDGLPR